MTDFFITYKSLFVIIHAIGAAVGLGAVVITDALFFKYLKDFRISDKENETMRTISGVVWGVVGLMIVTGIALYLSAPMDYLAKSKFIVKVIIFVVIILNGIVLNAWITPALKKISFGPVIHQPQARLRFMRRLAFASGAISGISWFTVFILGSVRSIPVGVTTGLLVYGGLIVVGILGSQIVASYLKYGSILPDMHRD